MNVINISEITATETVAMKQARIKYWKYPGATRHLICNLQR